ncbi:MAG: bacteriocin [Lachnospiraceae bacterium]|nr:bacteriocin [Lachnospiraceae bacterium]MBR5667515.1 bacteriocin [Lachnospiraceae bacterium]
MFKSLSKNEMMNVNGGFKYIPVYNVYITRTYLHGQLISVTSSGKQYAGTQQVANNDPRSEIVHTYTKYIYA